MADPLPPGAAPPWAPAPPDGVRTAQWSAARLGAYVWWEQKAFELLGGWAPTVAEPDLKVALAEHGDHAAWRAERWFEQVPPILGDVPRQSWCEAPTGADGVLAAVVAETDGEDRALERLVAAHRVLLPRLATAYQLHLWWASSLADGPVARLLSLLLADVANDVRAGAALLEARLGGPDAVARAGRCQEALEGAVVAAGGLVPA